MSIEIQREHKMTKEWMDVVAKYAKLSSYVVALNIGTGSGLSLYSIAMSGDGRIHTIDPQRHSSAKDYAKTYGYFKRVNFFIISSQEYFDTFRGNYFDLIVIDGSHEYEDVRKDIEFGWEVLNIGGYMVCDDYGHPTIKDHVGRAVDEFASKYDIDIIKDRAKAIMQKQ